MARIPRRPMCAVAPSLGLRNRCCDGNLISISAFAV